MVLGAVPAGAKVAGNKGLEKNEDYAVGAIKELCHSEASIVKFRRPKNLNIEM